MLNNKKLNMSGRELGPVLKLMERICLLGNSSARGQVGLAAQSLLNTPGGFLRFFLYPFWRGTLFLSQGERFYLFILRNRNEKGHPF